jgi:hypothetical protein
MSQQVRFVEPSVVADLLRGPMQKEVGPRCQMCPPPPDVPPSSEHAPTHTAHVPDGQLLSLVMSERGPL